MKGLDTGLAGRVAAGWDGVAPGMENRGSWRKPLEYARDWDRTSTPLTGTWPSTMRVCQFRHPGVSVEGIAREQPRQAGRASAGMVSKRLI